MHTRSCPYARIHFHVSSTLQPAIFAPPPVAGQPDARHQIAFRMEPAAVLFDPPGAQGRFILRRRTVAGRFPIGSRQRQPPALGRKKWPLSPLSASFTREFQNDVLVDLGHRLRMELDPKERAIK